MWTRFMDMHSGGKSKLNWEYIYIEADMNTAIEIFRKRFGRDPFNVTCCGPDYLVYKEADDIGQITAFERNCRFDDDLDMYLEEPQLWGGYMTLEEWIVSGEAYFMVLPRDGNDQALTDPQFAQYIEVINPEWLPCPHKNKTLHSTGGFSLGPGGADDDIQDYVICLDCGETLDD